MAEQTVRPAVPGDTSEILSVAEAGWTETYDDILSEETVETALEEWYGADETREAITSDEIGYFVAERDCGIVGYLSGSVTDESVGYLGAIYVRPEHWAAGVGSALLGEFETWCRNRDCTEIQLHVLSENTIAQSFYRKHGYESVETEQTELFGEQVSQQPFRGPIED